MRLLFKVIMAFLMIIATNSILCQASEAGGIKATIIDKSGISTDVDNFTIEIWHDYISIQKGYTITHIPFRNTKEIDFSWENGKQFASLTTPNGKTVTGMVEYVGWNEIQGDTEFGPFHLQLNDTKKIIFNDRIIPSIKIYTNTSAPGSGFARSISLNTSVISDNTSIIINDSTYGERLIISGPGSGFVKSLIPRSNGGLGSGFAKSLNKTEQSFDRTATGNDTKGAQGV